MAEDKKFLNLKQLERYHSKVDAKMKTKVDRTVLDGQGATNQIDDTSALNGCLISTTLKASDKTAVSLKTTSANGASGILAQICAKDTDTNQGTRLSVRKDKVFYTKTTGDTVTDNDEIATKGDLKSINVGIYRGEFATKAALLALTGMEKNDYAIVTADETKENKTTRYRYGTTWSFEYVIENNDCIRLLGNEEVSQGPYNLPYFFYQTPSATDIKVTAKTIPLDNSFGPDGKKVVTDYTLTVAAAEPNSSATATDGLAGLMSASDKYKLDNFKTGEWIEVELHQKEDTTTGIGGLVGNLTADQITKLKEFKYPVLFKLYVDNGSGTEISYATAVCLDYSSGTADSAYPDAVFLTAHQPEDYNTAEGGIAYDVNPLTIVYNEDIIIINGVSYNCMLMMSNYPTYITVKNNDPSRTEKVTISTKGIEITDGAETDPVGCGMEFNRIACYYGNDTSSIEFYKDGTTGEYSLKYIDKDANYHSMLIDSNAGAEGLLTGYGKETEEKAVEETDTINQAIGKLAYKVEGLTIKLNNTATITPSFYAPTDAGATGKFVGWDDTGNKPTWKSIAAVMHFKGKVADLTELATKTSTATVGDVYYVTAEYTNYAYDGESTGTPAGWSDIGNAVDLSDYLLKYTKHPGVVMVTNTSNDGEIIPSSITTNELGVVHDLTGYTKATSESAIATSDTILSAFGKLEYAVGQRVDLSTNQTIGGTKNFSNEIQTTSANGLRLVQGDYGCFVRNDSNAIYVLLTAQGDPYGTWNDLRPIIINCSTGAVSINGVDISSLNTRIKALEDANLVRYS